MAERHDSTTEQGCFEAGREVGEWVGGGGQQRWQQFGGVVGFPRCSAGSGAGCSTVEAGAADRRVWDWDWDWD